MMPLRPKLSVLTLSVCLGLAAPAAAVTPATEPAPAALPPIPPLRLYLSSLNIVRYNPIGLETQNRFVLQKRLFDSESLLLRDTFVSGAASLKLSPASLKVGPQVELQPVAMFNLRAGYEYVRYFGTFGILQSFPSPGLDFSDDARGLAQDSAYSTSGHHFLVEPMLQAKVKQFAVRTKFSIEYWDMALREGDGGTFYDSLLDTLVPGKGWVFANDTDLLMLAGQWTLVVRYSGVFPRYEGATTADNSHMRVGPLVAYSFHTREGTSFNKPTLIVNLAWYLKHPNRESALPYLLAGFAFSSDFMPGR